MCLFMLVAIILLLTLLAVLSEMKTFLNFDAPLVENRMSNSKIQPVFIATRTTKHKRPAT